MKAEKLLNHSIQHFKLSNVLSFRHQLYPVIFNNAFLVSDYIMN